MQESNSKFSERGRHAVGVIETFVHSPFDAAENTPNNAPVRTLPTQIWYPAETGQAELHNAHHPLGAPHRATENLKPLRNFACPLIAFSHGNSGLRQQSTFLMTHLASWGFIVVAPDHVGNTFTEMMALPDEDARKETHRRIRKQRPHDLHAVIQVMLDTGSHKDRLPLIDENRLGLLGHSFGGWTAFKVPALEPRVRAICSLAPASEAFVGRKAFEPGELPLSKAIQTLILAAEDDVLVDLDTSVRPLVDRLEHNAKLEIIPRSDHFHFCDGIEILHRMHQNSPRPNQLRETRPYSELFKEHEMHALLNERVARFFTDHLTA